MEGEYKIAPQEMYQDTDWNYLIACGGTQKMEVVSFSKRQYIC